MTEDLRVDTALVRQSGFKLDTIAGFLPEPPASFSPSGTDALSTAIAGRVSEVVDPVLAQMPIAKDELTRFAQNVIKAADSYDSSDRQIAEEILKRLGMLEDAAAGGGSQAAGATGSAGSGAANSPAAGAGQSDQMGQLMQMPMQLAQQAAQIPMQLASMAAAIPQAMMQGVQSAVQQATELAQSGEGDEKRPEDEALTAEEAREERPEEKAEPESQAAPGSSGGERVPDASPPAPAPEAPAAPKPAPTRPAESVPEIAL